MGPIHIILEAAMDLAKVALPKGREPKEEKGKLTSHQGLTYASPNQKKDYSSQSIYLDYIPPLALPVNLEELPQTRSLCFVVGVSLFLPLILYSNKNHCPGLTATIPSPGISGHAAITKENAKRDTVRVW